MRPPKAHVAVVDAVGDDPFRTLTIENLRSEGVDVRHVITIARHGTGVAPTCVEPDRSDRILITPGADACMDPAPAHLDVAVRSACAPATDSVRRHRTQESLPTAIVAARIMHGPPEARP